MIAATIIIAIITVIKIIKTATAASKVAARMGNKQQVRKSLMVTASNSKVVTGRMDKDQKEAIASRATNPMVTASNNSRVVTGRMGKGQKAATASRKVTGQTVTASSSNRVVTNPTGSRQVLSTRKEAEKIARRVTVITTGAIAQGQITRTVINSHVTITRQSLNK